ncbi:MAG: hypothetical protein MI810_22180 [Flavobacteriales bacterium]|nr:hypothetical protein [Flavobacteriales bacterium]
MKKALKDIGVLGLICFCASLIAYGQKHNNFWYFGNQQAIDFSNGQVISVSNSQMQSIESSSSYSNPETGELLLYTNGQAIWNAQHDTMPNGGGIWGHQSATQGSIICPLPGSKNLLYVFHIDKNGFAQLYNGSLNYSVVDLNLDDGLGDVIPTQKNIELMSNSTEKVSIIKHTDGCGFWVLAHKDGTNEFHAHHLTDKGFSETIVSAVGTVHEDTASTSTVGEMSVSLNGDKIALVVHKQQLIEIFDFNAENGTVSAPIKLQGEEYDYGIEFSPNGQLLYVSNFGKNGSLRQYNLTLKTSSEIEASAIKLKENEEDELRYGGLALGPDSVLYVKRSTYELFPDSLGAILSPDSLGIQCNFVPNYIYVPLNHGAHAYGPELNFSNLMGNNALPLQSNCNFTPVKHSELKKPTPSAPLSKPTEEMNENTVLLKSTPD